MVSENGEGENDGAASGTQRKKRSSSVNFMADGAPKADNPRSSRTSKRRPTGFVSSKTVEHMLKNDEEDIYREEKGLEPRPPRQSAHKRKDTTFVSKELLAAMNMEHDDGD